VTTTEELGVPAGSVFRVLGNDLRCSEVGVFWMGKSGRRPTPQERATAREPFNRPKEYDRPQVDDDDLSDEEAIHAAMAEQVREPADLVNVAA